MTRTWDLVRGIGEYAVAVHQVVCQDTLLTWGCVGYITALPNVVPPIILDVRFGTAELACFWVSGLWTITSAKSAELARKEVWLVIIFEFPHGEERGVV